VKLIPPLRPEIRILCCQGKCSNSKTVDNTCGHTQATRNTKCSNSKTVDNTRGHTQATRNTVTAMAFIIEIDITVKFLVYEQDFWFINRISDSFMMAIAIRAERGMPN